MHKAGFVAIVGRPNVGKSTLLNKIVGQKIAITTDKAQTTRRRIKGVFTNEQGQIVFIDTPGIYKPFDKLGDFLMEESKQAIPDADLILFVVDVSTSAGKGDKWIVENLLQTKTPIIIVLNKADKIKNMLKREQNILSYKLLFKQNLLTAPVSAKTGRNIDDFTNKIFRYLPEGENIYDEDDVTDETMRNIVVETIREKILENTRDEIPHCVAVEIEEYKEEESIDKIRALIYVEQDSQKGIIIGKKASMLKKIGTEARQEIEKITEKKAFLDLQVKVEKDWRKNKSFIEKWNGCN